MERLRPFIVRDCLVLAVTVALWGLALRLPDQTSTGFWVSVGAGLGATACAYLLHEWAHLVAVRMTGSVHVIARRVSSPFLFAYAVEGNTPRQFIIMSLAGFAATACFVVGFTLLMPHDHLAGWIAIRGAWLLSALTLVLEGPIFVRACVRWTVPRTGLFDGERGSRAGERRCPVFGKARPR